MVYHWDGVEPFRLTHRGNPRTYNVSGMSLVVLRKTVSGALRRFRGAVAFGPGVSGLALYSDAEIVLQVRAESGWRTVDIGGFENPSAGRFRVVVVDALNGDAAPVDAVTTAWRADRLSISFMVPEVVNGADQTPPSHLAYLVVTPLLVSSKHKNTRV
jgi:hypothetical protein